MNRKTTSWSEIQTWCTCHKKWYWRYDRNIERVRVKKALSTGSCGHIALAALRKNEDWNKAISTWYQKQLNEPLFDEEIAEIEAIVNGVTQIIQRYQAAYINDWKPFVKDGKPVVEWRFNIPINAVPVRLIGVFDAILVDYEGKLWLDESKFPGTFRDEDSCILDGQIGVYQWAAYKSGMPVIGTVYNQILARVPAIPAINKDGSLSRSKIYTDWLTYKQVLEDLKLNVNDYLEMENKLADFQFFRRYYIFRPGKEIKYFADDFNKRVWDMCRTNKYIYRCEDTVHCNMCSYKELCIEESKGGDIEDIIEHEFTHRLNEKERSLLNE